MKLAQLELEFDGVYFSNETISLCKHSVLCVLEEFGFILPRKFSKLWFTLYDLSSKDRQKLKISKETSSHYQYPRIEYINYRGVTAIFENNRIDDILQPFVGKTVYLKVEYEV